MCGTTGAAERLDLVCLIVESAPPHPPQTLPQPNNVEGDAVVQGLVRSSAISCESCLRSSLIEQTCPFRLNWLPLLRTFIKQAGHLQT